MACQSPTISPSTISTIVYGRNYEQEFTVAGGFTGNETFSISSGVLVAGLSLDTVTGTISGCPVEYGSYSFTLKAVRIQGLSSCSSERTYSGTIATPTSLATQADQYNRLQHFMCCLGSKGAALATKLKYSTDCCCDINTLELLVLYWEVLQCYNPTLTTNCLTQTQIDAIWDDISCKCGLCFSPYGSLYVSDPAGCGNRVVSGGGYRITSNGNIRVIACGTASTSTNGIGSMYITTGTPGFIVT